MKWASFKPVDRPAPGESCSRCGVFKPFDLLTSDGAGGMACVQEDDPCAPGGSCPCPAGPLDCTRS